MTLIVKSNIKKVVKEIDKENAVSSVAEEVGIELEKVVVDPDEEEEEQQQTPQQTTTQNQQLNQSMNTSQSKFYIQNKEANVKENVLEVGGEFFESVLNILEKDSKIYVRTSKGYKEIKILPEEAISKANKIENVNKVTIGQEGEAVYLISGTKKARLFLLFPITADVEQKINVENGELVSTKKPWWSFWAFGV